MFENGTIDQQEVTKKSLIEAMELGSAIGCNERSNTIREAASNFKIWLLATIRKFSCNRVGVKES